MRHNIGPDTSERLLQGALSRLNDILTSVEEELARTEGLLNVIEANAQRFAKDELDNLRLQAMTLINLYLKDRDTLRGQIQNVATAISVRRQGAGLVGAASLAGAEVPA